MVNDGLKGSLKTEKSEPAAFDDLYEKYRDAVYSFAYYLSRNRSEAEDLFQETWLRVVKNMNKMNDAKNVKAWIFTIMVNLYRDALRKRRVRRFLIHPKSADASPGSLIERYPSGEKDSDPERAAASNRTAEAIAGAVARLPDRQRMVFTLRAIEGFGYSEISKMCNMPLGTVKSLLNRGIKRLRKALSAFQPV